VAKTAAVANSSDVDSDLDDAIEVAPASSTRTLKVVSIPVMARATMKKAAIKAESTSPTDTSLSSLGSPASADYDTPGTTPATSVKGASIANKRKRSTLGRNVIQIDDSDAEAGMEDSDETLARRLQEEEYAAEEVSSKKRVKRDTYHVVDSEDESELSELESVQSDDVFRNPGRKSSGLQSALERAHKGQKVKAPAPAPSKGKHMSLPNRVARNNARKSIGQTLHTTKIEDSENSGLEELSELDSDDDVFIADDTEALSTGVSDAESEMAGSVSGSVSATAAPVKRVKSLSKSAGRRRRFGNITAERAAEIADEIEEITLGRKERERKKLEKASTPGRFQSI